MLSWIAAAKVGQLSTLLVALVFLLLPYIVVGALKLPRSLFAEAALHGLENWRLKKWLAGSGAYPEDTHFDGLDWEVGLTEVVCHGILVVRKPPTCCAARRRCFYMRCGQLAWHYPHGAPRRSCWKIASGQGFTASRTTDRLVPRNRPFATCTVCYVLRGSPLCEIYCSREPSRTG